MPKRKACFYGVRHGYAPGVYDNWEDCKRQVTGFPGNEYKSFSTRLEAEHYVCQNSSDNQGILAQAKKELVKEDSRNVRPRITNFREAPQQQYIEKIVTSVREPILSSKLAVVDRSNLVKLVEENEQQFFAFQSLKDFDLYFQSLAYSNCLDGNVKTNKAEHDIEEQKSNLATNGILERKDAEFNAEDVYQIEFDGASKGNPGQAGAGALIRCPHGSVVVEVIEYLGHKTNNFAEYSSLILGLNAALSKGARRVKALGDSKLVCLQVTGAWKVENENIIPLFQEVKRLEKLFDQFSIAHVRREYNSRADALANDAVLLGETEKFKKVVKPLPECCTKSE